MVAFALWFQACLGLYAQDDSAPAVPQSPPEAFAAAAKKACREARTRYETARHSAETAWQFGRACFNLADYATNHTERAEISQQGIAACREAIASKSNSAPAHYYLAANLGQLARTKRMSALNMVDQIQAEFRIARSLDESYDYAGPDRGLGLLYRDAPSVISIGNRSKARQHLEHAAELAPQFPENRLNLLETYLKWGERGNARKELVALQNLWQEARAMFAGEAWVPSWADWEPRLKKARKKIEDPPKALETPRHG